jgi:branched-chain amino acid transport system substrate-binding protein
LLFKDAIGTLYGMMNLSAKRLFFSLLLFLLGGTACLPTAVISEPQAIKIGAIFSLTGWAATGGKPELQGAQMAIEEINAKGGVNGRKLELIVEDNRSDFPATIGAFKKLRGLDNVSAIIGPNWSEFGEVVAPLAQSQKIPTVLITGLASKRTYATPYTFGLLPEFSEHVKVLSQHIAARNFKRLVVLYSPTIYFEGITNALIESLKSAGVGLLPPILVSGAAPNMNSILARVSADQADGIVAFLQEGGGMSSFLKQLKTLKLRVPIFSHDIKYDHAVTEDPQLAAGVIFIHYILQAEAKFIERYRSKFKEEPSISSPRAYDSIYALKASLENCPSSVLAECILKVDHQGTAGRIRFNERGGLIDMPNFTELWTVEGANFKKLSQ